MPAHRILARVFSFALLACTLAACGGTIDPPGAPMVVGGPIVPPDGFVRFCIAHASDCDGVTRDAGAVALTPERMKELEQVQGAVNVAVRPRKEPANEWDYPSDGYGDCNRYALEKRRELEARGWPRDALLLTVALTERDEGHLVLVARTSEGDLVLDNRSAGVVDWSRLPYRWLARQNASDPMQWVRIASSGSQG